jgi:two-component system response regulator
VSKSKSSPARILLVEDNPGDVLLLRLALDQHEPDCILDTLRDGAEAIRFVNDQWNTTEPEPCVIVLDWHLPKHDGSLVLRSIRKVPGMSHVHVVALTSLLSPKDEMEIERLGVRLYRTKPSDLDGWHQLAGEILEICRESSMFAVS